jgi:hypothetical protein
MGTGRQSKFNLLLRLAFAFLNTKGICAELRWTKKARNPKTPRLEFWGMGAVKSMKGTAPLLNCRNSSTDSSVQICGRLCKIISPRLTPFAVLSVLLVKTLSLPGARAPIQAQAIYSTFEQAP